MRQNNQGTRHPYTYAVDFVRGLVTTPCDLTSETTVNVPLLSRVQAAHIWHTLAKVWGLDEEEAAKVLADAFLSVEK